MIELAGTADRVVHAGEGVKVHGVFGHWLKLRLDPTARLVWAVPHEFAFGIDPANQNIAYTRSIIIVNGGRAAAENVEIVLAFRPQFIQFAPPRQYTEIPLQHAHVIRFDHLGPRERLSLEMLNVSNLAGATLPIIAAVRSKAGDARQVPVIPQRVFPLRVRAIFIVLELMGAVAILGLLIWLAGQALGL